MMSKINFLLILSLILGACASPKAEFSISGDTRAPATITFTNESSHAESFEWTIGDELVQEETSPTYTFDRAGNYLIRLLARKGKKEAVSYQRIFIEGPQECLVLIETEFGNMVVKLYNATPEHQANFMKLASEGFYNELLFHRVIEGFMIQGGDPNSRNASSNQPLGAGGPGYTLPAEFVDTLIHVKGALAAARTGDQVNPQKRSSGSQFYIVQGRPTSEATLKTIAARGGFDYSSDQVKSYIELGGTPFLDQNYTVFGQVIDGLDVIDKIAAVRKGPADRPIKDVKMKISVIDYFLDKKLKP